MSLTFGKVWAQDGHMAQARRQAWRRLLVEPARPALIRDHANAQWLVVGTVCVGAFMGQLDASIVTLAFPTLRHSFHTTLAGVQWVGLSYLLVLVSLLTGVGRMADMAGRKLLYTYGFVLFIAGSALCGLAPSLVALIVFRMLQAVGAAMLQANSVAIITTSVPRNKLGRAIGVQGAAQALGLSLGPAAGGLLIALGGWRLIFLVNIPLGMVGAVLGWLLIPRSRHLQGRERFDWPGLVFFALGVSALMLALSFGNEKGFGSAFFLGLLVAAGVLLIWFVRIEANRRAPMLDLSLFRRPAFSAGISSGLLSYLVLFGTLFVVPFYLQGVARAGPGTTGLELTALPVALAVVAPTAGRLADRIGPRRLTVGGMAVSGTALVLMSVAYGNPALLVIELALIGAGLGAFTPPNNSAVMGSVPREQAGVASGVLNTTRGLGTSLGLAITGLVFGLVTTTAAGPLHALGRGLSASTRWLLRRPPGSGPPSPRSVAPRRLPWCRASAPAITLVSGPEARSRQAREVTALGTPR